MEEIWKDVCFEENNTKYDYTGLYQVSNLGNVKYLPKRAGTHNRVGKVCRGYLDKNGYYRVYLCKNKKIKTIGVHKLVALMFIINTNEAEYNQINHKDENKQNNKVDIRVV